MGTESVSEMNAAHLTARATALDSAIAGALASKGAALLKPAKVAAAPVVAPAAEVPAEESALDAESVEPMEPAPDAPPEEPPAEDEPAPSADLAELTALGKKKDLRALEKKLGLEEGSLGVNNGSWAAYRRRADELSANEGKLANSERTLIGKFGPAVDLIQHARNGDLKAYAEAIAATTGISIEAFVEHWSKNVPKLDPRTLELERENARLRGPAKPEPAPEAAKPDIAAATKRADDYITAEAGKHPAFKLEGAKDGVRKLWLNSYDKASQAFGLTPQQAAGEFVKQRKAAYEREQWILSGKTPPPKPRTKALSRSGAGETQVRSENLTREQIIERAAVEWRRQKARDKR